MWNGLGNTPSLFPTVILFNEACNHEFFSIINFIFPYFKLPFQCILIFFPVWKYLLSFVYVFIYCVGAGITTLMSISDGSEPYFFCRKMEKTRSVKEEMDGKVFISRQSRHFWLWCDDLWSTFPYLFLDLAGKQLCFPPRKGINRRNKKTVIII